jgi:hypothetical protein
VKDVNGVLLTENGAARNRWAEYFERLLLHVKDNRDTVSVATGGERGMPVLRVLTEEWISRTEIEMVLRGTKSGKAPGLHGCAAECLKKGGGIVIE